jgi:hypothetical protein
VPRPKVNEFVAEIRDIWKAMTKDEQVAATEVELQRIAGTKEMKQKAAHSVALNAFHDVRANIASVQNQVSCTYLQLARR